MYGLLHIWVQSHGWLPKGEPKASQKEPGARAIPCLIYKLPHTAAAAAGKLPCQAALTLAVSMLLLLLLLPPPPYMCRLPSLAAPKLAA
jgi:hypothetical protein